MARHSTVVGCTCELIAFSFVILSPVVWFFGDPHFVTLDGRNYTFNGLGEYTMVDFQNGSFLVQARTEKAPGDNKATVFTAGAAKETGSSKAEVKVKSGGKA